MSVSPDPAARVSSTGIPLFAASTGASDIVDSLTALAALLCGAVRAYITVPAAEWQTLFQSLSSDALQPLSALCTQTLAHKDLFELVGDEVQGPLVAKASGAASTPLRHYAGVPLRDASGKTLGTLCVLGHMARRLDATQRTALIGLGQLAVHLLSVQPSPGLAIEERIRLCEQLSGGLLERLPTVIGYLDHELINRYTNPAGGAWHFKRAEELQGVSLQAMTSEALVQSILPHIERALAGEPQNYERCHIDTEGRKRGARVSLIPDLYNGATRGFFVHTVDIGDLLEASAELEREKERFRGTLDTIIDGVLATDVRGIVTFANPAACLMSPSAHPIGHHVADILKLESDVPGAHDSMRQIIALMSSECGSEVNDSYYLIRPDGARIAVEMSVATIRESAGLAIGRVFVIRDVSPSRDLAKRMSELAHRDILTQLPNRLMLEIRIAEQIRRSQASGHSFALIFVDLDGFKHINDSRGYQTGDLLLRHVAARLSAVLRPEDTIARTGGDEFILVIEAVDVEQIQLLAEQLRHELRAPLEIAGAQLHVTASLGISLYPHDAADAETLMGNADIAMFNAKRNGRDCYRIFSLDMRHKEERRTRLESELRTALRDKQFVIYYQPKVNCQDGAVWGAEALLRWAHPERGLLAPDQFIDIAEETGLILPIGQWVMSEACRQCLAWQQQSGLPLSIAVNVSAKQFIEPNFLDLVDAALESAQLSPDLLEIEITESTAMENGTVSGLRVRSLRDKGINVAIDDFGTGYSSLSYLKRFPANIIKIDRSFIQDIVSSNDDLAMTRAIIRMSKDLRRTVVAEGVETRAQVDLLRRLRCDQLQGYYFSKPMPAAAFACYFEQSIQARHIAES